MEKTFRPAWFVTGAFFICVAVGGLLGRYDHVDSAKTIIPAFVLILGVALIGSAIVSIRGRR